MKLLLFYGITGNKYFSPDFIHHPLSSKSSMKVLFTIIKAQKQHFTVGFKDCINANSLCYV